ncbi:hypothetical protein ADK70_13860 [Streptomyces rimosus subsp. pseudoverticillatus]|nr:hypothetical protein ADK70_13860 [Streptomyces rimosus subsp. pseudoverticillatus]
MHVIACLPADSQPAWSVEVGDGGFCDPSHPAQSRAVRLPAVGDLGNDVPLPQATAVDLVDIAPVGIQRPRFVPRSSAAAPDGRHSVHQRQHLGDVVAVAAGQRHSQRNATTVGQHMVLGVRPPPVNRTRADFWATSPPLGLHIRDIDGGAGKVQPVRRPQLVQQHLLQVLRDACLLPFGQVPPAGRAGPEAQFLR